MPSWLRWLPDEWAHIQKFPRLAVALIVLAAGGSWFLLDRLNEAQVSNLKSQVALLKSQLAASKEAGDPLPTYSLGGSNLLIYKSSSWAPQNTAKSVEIDWNRLAGVNAYAVLRMRTDGQPTSWVQARIVNITGSYEVVGTTESHRGRITQVRLPLPRATGTQTYSMELRGEGAGLEGEIQLLATTR